MYNLLNGEFYKLRNTKCFYVCCAVIVAWCIFTTGCVRLADEAEKNDSQQAVEMTEESESKDVKIGVMDMEEHMLGTALTVVVAIFAAIFVIGDYGNGAIKNIAGKGYSREKVYLAKYLLTIFAVTILFLVAVIAAMICSVIGLQTDGINMELLKNLCQYGGVQLLLNIALAGTFIMIGEISRGVGAAVAINMTVVLFSHMVFMGLDLLFGYLKIDFQTSKYWITQLISECPLTGIDNRFVLRVAGSSILWITAALFAGILHFKKADIK